MYYISPLWRRSSVSTLDTLLLVGDLDFGGSARRCSSLSASSTSHVKISKLNFSFCSLKMVLEFCSVSAVTMDMQEVICRRRGTRGQSPIEAMSRLPETDEDGPVFVGVISGTDRTARVLADRKQP